MGRKKRPAEQRSHSAAARRRKKNERKYAFTCCVVLLLLLSVGAALSLTVFFPIETISVSGSTRYAEGDLMEASGLKTGDNILCFRASAAGDRLVERFPYIERARVTRVFPDTVSIQVTESEVNTAIETDGGYLLLSGRGRILEGPNPYPPDGCPRIIGFQLSGTPAPGSYLPKTEQERFDLLREIEAGLRENGLSSISVIDLRDLIEMRLLYDGRLAIKLGSRIDLPYKLRAAAEVIRLSVDSKTVGTLDVSVRPTMRLREINLYAADVWPFPESMRGDYERTIPKIRPMIPKPPEASSSAPAESLPPASPQQPETELPGGEAGEASSAEAPEEAPQEEEEETSDDGELPPLTVIEA
ncbi:cell division protein FtsQ/DivIB [Yanshouia hominis]|uniref:FtsQ-type POTRA domain-containing protein n=1 Tax=Yanshouia hominis TaxID=2763673 RepID=A0ABR7NF77_9FIRM|nr:FtsQ-type POTRA domain-containing protein [Yanshouia hominis]MBC8575056.1 FtsQ-type POTRA domain-containing protein [Yanshouia hominis]